MKAADLDDRYADREFCYRKLGSATLPAQPAAVPLAVAGRSGVTLLCTTQGLLAVQTSSMIDQMRDRESPVQPMAELPLPGACGVAISADEGLVAAWTEAEVHVFTLHSLLHDVSQLHRQVWSVTGAVQVLLRQQSPQAAIVTRQQQLLLAAVEDETLVPYEAPVVAAAWSLNGQRLALVDQQTVRTAEVLSDGTLDTSKGLKIEPNSQDCELRLHSIGWLNDTSLLLSGDDADEPGRSILMLAFWDDASGGSPHLREQFGRESGIAEPSQGPAMHFAIVPEWHLTFASDARLETAFVHALDFKPGSQADLIVSENKPYVGGKGKSPSRVAGLGLDFTYNQKLVHPTAPDIGDIDPMPVLLICSLDKAVRSWQLCNLKDGAPGAVHAPRAIPELELPPGEILQADQSASEGSSSIHSEAVVEADEPELASADEQVAKSILPSQDDDLEDEPTQIIDARPSAPLAPASNKSSQESQDEVAQLVAAGLTADLPDDDADFSSEDEDAVLVQAPAKEDSKEEWQDVASPDADDAADAPASASQPKAAPAAFKGKAEPEMANAEGAATGQPGGFPMPSETAKASQQQASQGLQGLAASSFGATPSGAASPGGSSTGALASAGTAISAGALGESTTGWGTPASRSGSSTPSGSGSKGSSRSGSGSLGVPAGARLPGAVPSLSGPGAANSTFAVPDLPSGGFDAPWSGAQSSSRTALVSSQEPVNSTFAAMGSTSGGFGVLSGKAQSGAASRLGGIFAAQDGPQLAAATGLGSASSVFAASSFASTAPSLTFSAPGLGSAFGPTTAASSAASHFAPPGSSQQKQGQPQLQQQQQQASGGDAAAAAAAEGSQQAPWAKFQQRQELQQQASGSPAAAADGTRQQPPWLQPQLQQQSGFPGAAERQKAAAKASLWTAEEHRQQVLRPQQKGKGPLMLGTPEQGHHSAGAGQQADPAEAEQQGQARQHKRRQEVDAAVARVHRQEPKLAGEGSQVARMEADFLQSLHEVAQLTAAMDARMAQVDDDLQDPSRGPKAFQSVEQDTQSLAQRLAELMRALAAERLRAEGLQKATKDMQRRSTALAMFWPKAEAAQEGQHPEATNKLNSREQHQQLLASRPMEPSLAAKFQGAQQLAVQLRKRAAEVEHFVQVLSREDDSCAQVGSSRDWERLRQTINEHGTIMQRQVVQVAQLQTAAEQAQLLQVDEATAALRFDNSELEAPVTEDLTDSDDEEVVGVKLRNHSDVVFSARARIRQRGVFGPIDEQLAKLSLGSSPLRSPARSSPVSPWQSLRSSPAGQRQRGPLRSVSALRRTGQQVPDRSVWEGQSGDSLKVAILKAAGSGRRLQASKARAAAASLGSSPTKGLLTDPVGASYKSAPSNITFAAPKTQEEASIAQRMQMFPSSRQHAAAVAGMQAQDPSPQQPNSPPHRGGLERRASSGGPRAMSMSRSPSRDGSSQPEGRALPGTSSLGFRAGAASTFGASGSGAGEELPRKSKLPAAKGSVGQQQQPKLEAVAEEQAKGGLSSASTSKADGRQAASPGAAAGAAASSAAGKAALRRAAPAAQGTIKRHSVSGGQPPLPSKAQLESALKLQEGAVSTPKPEAERAVPKAGAKPAAKPPSSGGPPPMPTRAQMQAAKEAGESQLKASAAGPKAATPAGQDTPSTAAATPPAVWPAASSAASSSASTAASSTGFSWGSAFGAPGAQATPGLSPPQGSVGAFDFASTPGSSEAFGFGASAAQGSTAAASAAGSSGAFGFGAGTAAAGSGGSFGFGSGAAPSGGSAIDFGAPSSAATAGTASSQGTFSLTQPFGLSTSGAAAGPAASSASLGFGALSGFGASSGPAAAGLPLSGFGSLPSASGGAASAFSPSAFSAPPSPGSPSGFGSNASSSGGFGFGASSVAPAWPSSSTGGASEGGASSAAMPPASLASGFAGFGLSSPATPQGGAATNPFGGMNSTPAASSSGFGFGQLATPSGAFGAGNLASGSFGSFGGSSSAASLGGSGGGLFGSAAAPLGGSGSSPARANPFAPAATGAPGNLFGGTTSAAAGNAFGGAFGQPGAFSGVSGSSGFGQPGGFQTPAFGQPGAFGSGAGQAATPGSSFGQPGTPGGTFGQPATPGFGQAGTPSTPFGGGAAAGSGFSAFGAGSTAFGQSAGFGAAAQQGGGFEAAAQQGGGFAAFGAPASPAPTPKPPATGGSAWAMRK